MTAITAVIISKNEQSAIAACIQAVAFCDQVLVIDSRSLDETTSIARRAGAEVIDFDWNGLYPKKKQWSLEHPSVRNDWVLLLDADELVSPTLALEVTEVVATPGVAVAFDIPLDYWFAGKRLDYGHRVKKRSLLNRKHVRFPAVDDLQAPGGNEVEGHYQPTCDGPIGTCVNAIDHRDPDPVSTWIDRHNRYAGWEAYLHVHPDTRRAVRAARSKNGQLFDRLPMKPLVFFVFSYLLRQGFRDGRAGFDYAFGLAWYYWLIEVKVREYGQKSVGAS